MQRDENFETSVDGVYVIGDAGGMEGAHAAMAQGHLAGLAAAGDTKTHDNVRKFSLRLLARHHRFQKSLWRAFESPPLALQFADDDTLVCRCEAVTLGRMKALVQAGEHPANIKREARAGMGHCQGRYCSWLLLSLIRAQQTEPLGESFMWAPRPPVRPISIHALAESHALTDEGQSPE